jgi:hypothetical protein
MYFVALRPHIAHANLDAESRMCTQAREGRHDAYTFGAT